MTAATARTALLTDVSAYAGPGALPVLLAQGWRVACHDAAFADGTAREAFEARWPGAIALAAAVPEALADEALARLGALDAAILNAAYPIRPRPIDELDLDDLRATFAAVTETPIRLAKRLLPAFRARLSGAFVFVTSARERRPEPGYAIPTALRAGTTAFAKALAKETAADGIAVNVVAPNYLASELYYPRAKFVDDPDGRAAIARIVPAGRLGAPEEIGELIAFLASGRASFVTGQVVDFTGGWP